MLVDEYRFQGKEGEKVPESVQKLRFNPDIQVLPYEFCYQYQFLREVALPEGLIKIGFRAFCWCTSLLTINICSTVESIGQCAFEQCKRLGNVEFGVPSSSSHQLKSIGYQGFLKCLSLQRIKLPPSVSLIGMFAFKSCDALVEAILSSTSITEIPRYGFAHCHSLQMVSLPKSLERISDGGFSECRWLVTVIMSIDANLIEIRQKAFYRCRRLANLVLSQGSNAAENSFEGCTLIQGLFGGGAYSITAGLILRFEKFPVHKLCYDHCSTTAKELRRCIEEQEAKEVGALLVDDFGMTPFHVLLSNVEPREELLVVLNEKYPNYVLGWKDGNGKLAMDYLLTNWTATAVSLLETTLQKWVFSRLEHWRAKSWRRIMIPLVIALLAEGNKRRRMAVFTEICSNLKQYESVESTSILEMAAWKGQLNHGRKNDDTKVDAVDREECRCVCGSDVVIPNAIEFLGIIPRALSHVDFI